MMLVLRSLGGLVLEKEGSKGNEAAIQRAPLAILAFIAAAGDKGVSRDRIASVFWPESDTEHARGSLKQAVYAVRRSLGSQELTLGTSTLRLNPAVIRSDVGEFLERLAAHDWESAVAIHAGPFLDGIHLSGHPEFERWVDRERRQLAAAHAQALQELARLAESAGDLVAAVKWWAQLSAADMLSAKVAGSYIRALAASGDREAALRHARLYQTLVREELDTDPDPRIATLAEEIRLGHHQARIAAGRSPSGNGGALLPRAPADIPAQAGDSGTPNGQSISVSPRRRKIHLRLATGFAALTAVTLGAFAVLLPRPPKATADGLRQQPIAVLPCADDDSSSRIPGTGDRWSEELTDKLIRVGGLQLKSWSSVAKKYRDTPLATNEIATRLGAGTVVRCRVAGSSKGVSFKVEMIRGKDDVTIFSRHYEGPADPEGTNAIQVAVARDIASVLGRSVPTSQLAALSRPITHDSAALRLYRIGRFLLDAVNDDEKRSIGYFEKAIARDSSFAAAYASLAEAFVGLGEEEATPSQLYYPRVGWLARKAISLDPALSSAYSIYGRYLLEFTYDWQGAEEEHRKAIAADPGSGGAYIAYSWHLLTTERLEEAGAAAARALELDPADFHARGHLVRALVFQGKYDEALRLIPDGLELQPGSERFHYLLASIMMARGQRDSALASAERIQFPHWPPSAWLKSQLGRRGAAVAVLDTLLQRNRSIPVDPAHIAWIMVGIGDTAGALDWLEQAHRDRSGWLLYLLGPHPAFDGLRSHPRFQELRKRAGFPG